jgi:hypothetical protein
MVFLCLSKKASFQLGLNKKFSLSFLSYVKCILIFFRKRIFSLGAILFLPMHGWKCKRNFAPQNSALLYESNSVK